MGAWLDRPLRRRWKRGPAAGATGPFLISFTEFTPHRRRELPAIWLASERLGGELSGLEGACGVLTYLRPGRPCVGSLSAWAGEEALANFVSLPYHREIMRHYRSRGEPLRSSRWWAEELRVAAALVEGLRRLEQGEARRASVATGDGR